MATTLNPSEEAQLAQTIEMFEVITQSQPHDYQSLEILKEAYSKLGREKDAVGTAKRIAQAYVEMGQLSSAILEYETILQRCPDDVDVKTALQNIEVKASSSAEDNSADAGGPEKSAPETSQLRRNGHQRQHVDDGRPAMHKLFVESKVVAEADFNACWPVPDLSVKPAAVVEPFVQLLAQKGILPVEKSLRMISDKSKVAFLPLQLYELDMDLARSFPAVTCRRWCVMPFDRMSNSIMVATVNPFNQQAAKELAEATANRLLWYLATPDELCKLVRKAFH